METRKIIILIALAILGLAAIAITAEIRAAFDQWLIHREINCTESERRTTELRDALAGYDKFKQADADRRKFERLVGAK